MTKFPQLDRRNAMKLLLAAGAASGVASCGNGSETKSAPRKVSKLMIKRFTREKSTTHFIKMQKRQLRELII